MAKQITTEEVKKRIDSNSKDYYLVDVLMQNGYNARHVPTAKNVPYAPGFVEAFEKKINSPKDAEIIVYCASSGCQLSHLAADELEKAGYTNVYHYTDGLAGWQSAGHEFEGQ
ncbi:TPA: sulfurtransferase [Candidatus Kaiserbacteria bacterium]|nr:sulfurtransferase [Candidatus Kaiserbacteria bacterium]